MTLSIALIPFCAILVAGCANDEPVVLDKVKTIAVVPQSKKTLINSIWRTGDETNQIRILRLDSAIKGWQVLRSEKANCQCIFYLPLDKTQGDIEYSNKDRGYACQLIPRLDAMQVSVDEIEKCKKQPQFKYFTFIAGVFTLHDQVENTNQVFY